MKHKNKLPINGKPLVQHAIEVAKESGIFGNIIVSSDDRETLAIALEQGIIPHLRPWRLARNTCQIKHVCKFLFSIYDKSQVFCLLMPCHMGRTAEDLRAGYQLLWDKKANYVMSVKRATPPPQLARRLIKGFIDPATGLKRSQELTPMYYHDGSFIFAKTDIFLIEFDYGFYGSRCLPYVMPRKTVDIDTPEDYEYARWLFNKEAKNELLL